MWGRHRAFGLVWETEIVWPGCPAVCDPADVVVRRGSVAATGDVLWRTVLDDCPVSLARREDGAHVLAYGDRARFGVLPGAAEVVVDAGPRAVGWLRFLLDTVALTVSHLRGYELLHGGAVAVDGGAVAVLGPTGAGKTSVLAALLARGHALVSDDVLALDRAGDGFVVHPGPPLMNVPAGLDAGRVLAEVGDEAWVAVPGIAAGPLPLRAILVLNRNGSGPPAVSPLPASPLGLLGHAIGFEQSPRRDARRFGLLSDVAERVPVLRLCSGPEASPDALAACVESVARPAVAV